MFSIICVSSWMISLIDVGEIDGNETDGIVDIVGTYEEVGNVDIVGAYDKEGIIDLDGTDDIVGSEDTTNDGEGDNEIAGIATNFGSTFRLFNEVGN